MLLNLGDELQGVGSVLLAAEYVTEHSKVHVVICKDQTNAVRFYEQINFILKKNPVECLLFPDWETLPYDRFSLHPDLVSDRLYALTRLTQSSHLVFITTINTNQDRQSNCHPQSDGRQHRSRQRAKLYCIEDECCRHIITHT